MKNVKNTSTVHRMAGINKDVTIGDLSRVGRNYTFRVIVGIVPGEKETLVTSDIPTLRDLRRGKNRDFIARGGWGSL